MCNSILVQTQIILKSNFSNQSSALYRFCQGENDAIGAIFSEVYTELYFTAFRFTQNEKDAEDVVSDCFEKLIAISIERRQQIFIENNVELKSYLLVMIKHKSLDFLKVKKNRNSILASISSFWKKSDENEHLIRSENDHILLILELLTEREKQIMRLSIDGYSIDEIKEELLISKKTVSNILQSARKKIKLFIEA